MKLIIFLMSFYSFAANAEILSTFCHTGAGTGFNNTPAHIMSICFETESAFIGSSAQEKAVKVCDQWADHLGIPGAMVAQSYTDVNVCYHSRLAHLDNLNPSMDPPWIHFTESNSFLSKDDWGRMDTDLIYEEYSGSDQQYVRGYIYYDDGGASNHIAKYYNDGQEKAQWLKFTDNSIYCGFVDQDIAFSSEGTADFINIRRPSTPDDIAEYSLVSWEDRTMIYQVEQGLVGLDAKYLKVWLAPQYSRPTFKFYNLVDEVIEDEIINYELFYFPSNANDSNGSEFRMCE